MYNLIIRRLVLILVIVPITCLVLPGCEDSEAPPLPFLIVRASGDGQSSKRGTELPDPLVVRVTLSDGSPAAGLTVRFREVAGGGLLSPADPVTNARGYASARLILGDAVGTNTVRATIATDNTKSVDFNATALEYYCTEEDPTFDRKFFDKADLFLFTRRSALNKQNGQQVSGIVRLKHDFPGEKVSATSFKKFEEEYTISVVNDAAFSRSGDFYLSWRFYSREVIKLNTNITASHFGTLESDFGAEITYTPGGILVGCDEMGPFYFGCQDTLTRFSETLYEGTLEDRANHDAVAVDPNTEDIYFIYLPDATLRRLPVDSLVATGPVESITQLTADEAAGANGMVCAEDGTVYILVDTDGTKAILSVTSSGDKSVVYDFFDRGSGEAAGVQNDLALWQRNAVEVILFTVDTQNDVLLAFRIPEMEFVELPPDVAGGTDPESISTVPAVGERVGLVVLP